MERVLITGGTGFIGAHLARACLARGDHVTVLARPDSDAWRLTDLDAQLDILRAPVADFGRAAKDAAPDLVFHLASRTRFQGSDDHVETLRDTLAETVDPILTLLHGLSATPPKAFIRSGTLAEFGGAPSPYHDGSPTCPASAYGVAALAASHALRFAARQSETATVTARLCLTYGPDQSESFLIPSLIRAALSAQTVHIRNPAATRSLLHVFDTVAALLLIADRAARLPPLLIVSNPTPHRMMDLAARIDRLAGRVPANPPRPSDIGATDRVTALPSPALLAEGWSPQISLDSGLAATIAHEVGQLEERPQWLS